MTIKQVMNKKEKARLEAELQNERNDLRHISYYLKLVVQRLCHRHERQHIREEFKSPIENKRQMSKVPKSRRSYRCILAQCELYPCWLRGRAVKGTA